MMMMNHTYYDFTFIFCQGCVRNCGNAQLKSTCDGEPTCQTGSAPARDMQVSRPQRDIRAGSVRPHTSGSAGSRSVLRHCRANSVVMLWR